MIYILIWEYASVQLVLTKKYVNPPHEYTHVAISQGGNYVLDAPVIKNNWRKSFPYEQHSDLI